MLLKNLDVGRGLANGTQGQVIGFGTGLNPWPVVRFTLPRGQRATINVQADAFNVEVGGKVLASRVQVPLMLSWAMTVHKSQGPPPPPPPHMRSHSCAQGSTITGRAVLDLGPSIFEAGQAYVALSRMTRLQDVTLMAFDPKCVKAHPVVLAWLEKTRVEPIELEWE